MSGRKRGGRRSFSWSGTRRAAILAVVVCALGLTVAVPLRTYLGQRAEITAQIHEKHRLQSELARLRHRKAQLSDPAHVEAEARRRLRYVMPGETPYVVQLPGDTARGSAGQHAPQPNHRQPPWYQGLWQHVTEGQ